MANDIVAVEQPALPEDVISALNVLIPKDKREAQERIMAYYKQLREKERELDNKKYEVSNKMRKIEEQLTKEVTGDAYNYHNYSRDLQAKKLKFNFNEKQKGDIPEEVLPMLNEYFSKPKRSISKKKNAALARDHRKMQEELSVKIDAKLKETLQIAETIYWHPHHHGETPGKEKYHWTASVRKEVEVDLAAHKEMNALIDEYNDLEKKLKETQEKMDRVYPYLPRPTLGFIGPWMMMLG